MPNTKTKSKSGKTKSKKAAPKVKYPKHPRAFAAGGQLPSTHYQYRYIFEAELKPKPSEKWVSKFNPKYPWKGTNPTLIVCTEI